MRLSAFILSSLLAISALAAPAGSVGDKPQAVLPGEPLAPWSYPNLNEGVAGPPKIDLAGVLGKKPVVFCYWLPSSPSEANFLEVQSLAHELGPEKIVLYGVVNPDLGGTDDAFRARIRELKIQVPVLRDTAFRLNQQLSVLGFPSISVVDASGRLRLANGGSLRQQLEYKMDVETAIRRVAATGQLGTYGVLDRYYPAVELVGKKAPDFQAPFLSDGVPRQWSGVLARDKINVLVFWSVDCPHCRHSLPKLNDFLKQNSAGLNVIGAARISNDAMRTKTEEFCKLSGFVFENMADKDFEISRLYNVISTPTIVIIRPDGVVDSVVLSGETDFGVLFDQKRKALLKGSKS